MTGAASGDGEPRRYRIFGLTVETGAHLRTPLATTDRPPDLRFDCARTPPDDLAPPGGEPAYASPVLPEHGVSVVRVFTAREVDVIRYAKVADFYLTDDRIHCHLLDAEYDFMVDVRLLGPVFSFWFERRGVPMLHASAVAVEERAIVFMATNRGGKSSLAATFLEAGDALLSDDIVGIDRDGESFRGRPGYASMRLWPDEAARFYGAAWEELPLAHPVVEKRMMPVGGEGVGAFRDTPTRLAAIYLPERRDAADGSDEIEVLPVGTREAVIELVGGTFLPRLVHAVGLATDRFALFTDLVSAVPVRRLRYPDGVEHLPRVRRALLEDMPGPGG